ncbi:unnamed protein product [Cuscuta campestris]|uniref:Mediator of RNA polymerase II transcription subunit 9 n=2 Tax=Cuscuta sect. Cleistogrammica TaxID=1824901 RepID=A0A484KUG2_9ASTE|nr:hypothetical protein DM860_016975 [Cuscuta australis]VFQ69671.1 unnamed protein product [Cuscuta campestris]
MEAYGGGSWTMIPNIQTNSNPSTPSNQDHLFLQQVQQQQQQLYQQPQMQTQPPPPPQQQYQSLASHFHLIQLVENLADTIENGMRDQHSDALVNETKNQFHKCQQLLNSISASISSKSLAVEGQKRKLAEAEQLSNQRKELISKYKTSVEELIKSEQ